MDCLIEIPRAGKPREHARHPGAACREAKRRFRCGSVPRQTSPGKERFILRKDAAAQRVHNEHAHPARRRPVDDRPRLRAAHQVVGEQNPLERAAVHNLLRVARGGVAGNQQMPHPAPFFCFQRALIRPAGTQEESELLRVQYAPQVEKIEICRACAAQTALHTPEHVIRRGVGAGV